MSDGSCSARMEHFIDYLVETATPFVSGRDGLDATQVAQAMEGIGGTGLPVDVPPVSTE